MTRALIFLLTTFSQLYLLLLLLRFWLPVLRANFQNPVAQGVLRYTSPLVAPVRRIVPPVRRLDTATIIISFFIQIATLLTVSMLTRLDRGTPPLDVFTNSGSLLLFAIAAIVHLALLSDMLFIVAIFVRVILNLLGRYMGPLSDILSDLTQPLLRPMQRVIPPLGVVDLSAYIVIILLIALRMILTDLLPPIY